MIARQVDPFEPMVVEFMDRTKKLQLPLGTFAEVEKLIDDGAVAVREVDRAWAEDFLRRWRALASQVLESKCKGRPS